MRSINAIFGYIVQVSLLLSLSMYHSISAADELTLFSRAELSQQSMLTAASHTSDGSDRARNGKPMFQGPLGASAISYNGYQYVIYYSARDRGGFGDFFAEVIIARRKEGSDKWQHSTLPVYRVTSHDAHNRASIAISRGDGAIHISFDHHNTDRVNYARTIKGVADNPEAVVWDDKVFAFERNMGLGKDAVGRVTYPTFHDLPTGNLLMYFRSGGSTRGEMTLARYDANRSEWDFVRKISSRDGRFVKTVTDNTESTSRGPYILGGPKVDANGRMHISWLFRERPVNCNPGGSNDGRDCNQGLYYAYSDDEGITWHRSSGELVVDTSKGEKLSVETQGLQVIDIPTPLMPSNVSLNSVIDAKTGIYHAFIEHKPSPSENSILHRYQREKDGSWHTQDFGFSASNVSVRTIGDRMFAMTGRQQAKIYYSRRENDFTDWQEIPLSKLATEPHTIESGYITWDLSLIASGKLSLIWHRQPENDEYGQSSPIYVYDFKIGE
ncbi:BNR-4 repeat-containing protein [Glaciecola sp. SC05]|uniref:BNR-4 repeat-containing protein n=1 Tax=Glaciecola sp. SC05 TaxID=1987355 RepID=UPI003527D5DF